MVNQKAIGGFAACGFVLSFLTGLISKNAFLVTLLRSFIFALIFAALAACVSFLFKKFLEDDSVSDSISSDSASKNQRAGENVNIVIADDDLEDDDTGPKFFVENNLKNFQDDGAANISGAAESSEKQKKDFTPVEPQNLTEPVQTAAAESVSPHSAEPRRNPEVPENSGDVANKVNSFADGSSIDDLDELPDIEDIPEDVKNPSGSDIIVDSDFASSAKSSSGAKSVDASLMAQAIRTALKKDEN